MNKLFKNVLKSATALLVVVGLVGCGSSDSKDPSKEVSLAYVEWDTEVASTHVVAEVLEQQGFKVKTTPLDNAVMWESVANNETDAMVAAWLPATHGDQYAQYKDKVEDLGENLKGAKIGLVVPSYMNVKSIADLKGEANKEITAIEPGAGVVQAAEKSLKDYSNLSDWKMNTSSSGAMTVALDQAIKGKKEIVITGWSPHWMFQKYDLKYLEDDKGSFGKEEVIHTMARKDLKKDAPEAYKILDNFSWDKADIEKVMSEINEGKDPKEAAKDWVAANKDKVDSWIK